MGIDPQYITFIWFQSVQIPTVVSTAHCDQSFHLVWSTSNFFQLIGKKHGFPLLMFQILNSLQKCPLNERFSRLIREVNHRKSVKRHQLLCSDVYKHIHAHVCLFDRFSQCFCEKLLSKFPSPKLRLWNTKPQLFGGMLDNKISNNCSRTAVNTKVATPVDFRQRPPHKRTSREGSNPNISFTGSQQKVNIHHVYVRIFTDFSTRLSRFFCFSTVPQTTKAGSLFVLHFQTEQNETHRPMAGLEFPTNQCADVFYSNLF